MSTSVKTFIPLLIFCLFVTAPPAQATWIENGILVRVGTGSSTDPVVASDGDGGIIVMWEDYRHDKYDIYAQRIDPSGNKLWAADGVAVCTANGNAQYLSIVSDGSGGAIVAWRDDRNNGDQDIYAQRINASGVTQWYADGEPICMATSFQQYPKITSDGTGGAIVTWTDYRAGNWDVYAQRIDAAGIPDWMSDGMPICTTPENQLQPRIVSDGDGGAIIAWDDYRTSVAVYAQRIKAGGGVLWSVNGTRLCLDSGGQSMVQLAADGSGGAVAVWWDARSGPNGDIYAERVNESGVSQWNSLGQPLCTDAAEQYEPWVVVDGASVVVIWADHRNGITQDIYAQRLNASGVVQWTSDGVAVCTADDDQWLTRLVSDGAGGAVVTWIDWRDPLDGVYAQRIKSSGSAAWVPNGVPLCIGSGTNPEIATDGNGGAIVAWQDYRGTSSAVYAQRVDSLGQVGFLPLIITSVEDVPNDQGGCVRITIDSPSWDNPGWTTNPVAGYNVWQRVDEPALLASINVHAVDEKVTKRPHEIVFEGAPSAALLHNVPVFEWNGRHFAHSKDMPLESEFPPGIWEIVGSFFACQYEEYTYRADTFADSTASGIPYSVYMVSAHTTVPSIWVTCDPDSGYSVDNLPPDMPMNLVGHQSLTPEGLVLDWDWNVENDFSCYGVYRGSSEGFVPAAGNRIAAPNNPGYFDNEWRWDSGYYYKVSAIDIHGNESGFALLTPNLVTSVDSPVPKAAYVRQNFPNPFNPVTTIAFGLERPSYVSLKVYDAMGRLVRIIVDSNRTGGHYTEVWDGKDATGQAVSSGVYFYRFETGSLTRTMKMILL